MTKTPLLPSRRIKEISDRLVGSLSMRTFGIVLESFAALALAIAVNTWLDSSDPLGIKGDFPWVWLIPAIFTMRYGSLAGLTHTLLLLLVWYGYVRWFGGVQLEFPKQFFLGGLVLCLILGQFSDVFRARTRKIREANAYLEERLGSLTRTHFLLRLSHQRLEQELLVKPVTLRDSLDAITPLAVQESATLSNADALLNLLVQNCEIESATLFSLNPEGEDAQEVAHVGEAATLDPSDPVVSKALSEKILIHVRSEQATLFASKYLVAVPLITSNRELLGMLVVSGMPFLALNSENLQMLAVMLGYYADALRAKQVIRQLQVVFPACPADFALELVRTKRLYDQARIESSLVAFRIPVEGQGGSLIEFMRRGRRQSDVAWEIHGPTHEVHILLMPLAGHAAIAGMLDRLEEDMRSRFQLDFSSARIATHYKAIDRVELIWALDDLLNLCKQNTNPPSPPAPANDVATH